MKFTLFALSLLASVTATAAEYKCYSSKYPTNMSHAFENGYVLLNVTEGYARLKYFYVNDVANETTLEYDVIYSIGGLNGGNGKLKDLLKSKSFKVVKSIGESISAVYFEPVLIQNEDFTKSGVIGKFVFPGQGFGYDWNLCYNIR